MIHNDTVKVPTAYTEGYAKACLHDKEAADNYIKHTTIGDPELDPIMEELSDLPPSDLHRFIKAGIEQEYENFLTVPAVLRDWFDEVDMDLPSWVDFDAFAPAGKAFFTNMNNMLIAYAIGSAVEGFSTLVSKSFSMTGRVTGLGPMAARRLRQNNRHMIEVYYPEGLKRTGDGWKVSTRIRFIHARIRKLIADSGLWDYEAWGEPLSAAHVGAIALFTFSIRQFEHAIAMGSAISEEQRDSIVKTWRYAGYLLGVPEAILFTSEAEARRNYEIGHLCEPPPDDDAIKVATSVFEAIPQMAGVEDESGKKSLQMYAYRLSRALIGNELADRYGYPNTVRIRSLVLGYYRMKERITKKIAGNKLSQYAAFAQIFEATQYDEGGISYKMPDHVIASQSSEY